MEEYEMPICTFNAQSYNEGTSICLKTNICMICNKGKWQATIYNSFNSNKEQALQILMSEDTVNEASYSIRRIILELLVPYCGAFAFMARQQKTNIFHS